MNSRMAAVNIEDKDRSRRACEALFGRMRFPRIGKTAKHPGIAMRPWDHTRGAVLWREVDQGANCVARIPNAGHTLPAPIHVQRLLAVARSEAA